MNSFCILFTTLVFLSIGVVHSSANKCYSCTSEQSGCGDPFDRKSNSIQQVSTVANWCWKVKVEIGKEYFIQRGTGVIRAENQTLTCTENACYADKANKIKGTICCCNEDLCNSGGKTLLTGSAIIVMVLLHLFQY